jgi:Hypervirulence associated proteins TUDOR domain
VIVQAAAVPACAPEPDNAGEGNATRGSLPQARAMQVTHRRIGSAGSRGSPDAGKIAYPGKMPYPGKISSRPIMAEKFRVGSHVWWNSEAGRASGRIIKVHRKDVNYKGYVHHATKDDPQYEIKSD